MAATALAKHGIETTVFEKERGPGPKILIAGLSGLNISNSTPTRAITDYYDGDSAPIQSALKTFSVSDWLEFIHSLGIKTFEGTSHRYFIEGLKAGLLLKNWINFLKAKDVKFYYEKALTDFNITKKGVKLFFSDKEYFEYDAVCFCFGGGSWTKEGQKILWPEIFKKKGIAFKEFKASNTGHEVSWPEKFIKEAEGLPLKNITVTSTQGTQWGDIVITRYGLEGTPIYNLKESEKIFLDLKPDFTEKQIFEKLELSKENLSPMRRIKKNLNLCEASLSLIFHHVDSKIDLKSLSSLIKKFPVNLLRKRGLEEAISSAGGIPFSEVDENFMLKKYPGVYLAGEMLDWDAPTGGFLIQMCVSQGYKVGEGIFRVLND